MRHILLVIVSIAATTLCQARTIYVDANGTGVYPTIQAAINDTNHGDVIILQPGTYTGTGNRDIYVNKAITIRSIDPNDTNIVEATIIDCNGSPAEKHRGIGFVKPLCENPPGIFESTTCPDSNAELAGLTISNGYVDSYVYAYGGGILCYLSSPSIVNCVIKNNVAIRGGGIGITSDHYASNPTIINCTIKNNNAELGGGLYCPLSNATIINCMIQDNNALSDGGGIYGATSSMAGCKIINNNAKNGKGGGLNTQGSYATVINCVIQDNNSFSDGGGIYGAISSVTGCKITSNKVRSGRGGGIYCTANSAVTDSVLTNNTANEGGGIYCLGTGRVSNCVLTDNSAFRGGGIHCRTYASIIENCTIANNGGGGIYLESSSSAIKNCVVSGNTASYYVSGGGIECVSSNPIIANCTITSNALSNLYFYSSSPTITNSVLWNYTREKWTYDSLITISFSDVPGGWPGEGNIDKDPCFAFESEYHLLPGSPCIDAGTNDPCGGLSIIDLDGNPRVIDGNSDGIAKVDMGAFEFNPSISRLVMSNSQFKFSCAKYGPNPEPQVLQIRDCNGGILNWEIIENCPWLNISPQSGTSVGEFSEATITVDANQLDPGAYQADMQVISPSAAGSPQTISVILNVGQLLNVPENFNTIQSAIVEAKNFDWVFVADGVYTGPGNRDIDFMGKAITVRSQNGPETCIIDCNGTKDSPHRAFIFQNNETNRSKLDGFTVTNGYSSEGGAIYCLNSSPVINNCIFRNNSAEKLGGAIIIEVNPSSKLAFWGPVIINQCSFIENSSQFIGGAIYSDGRQLNLTKSTFYRNSAVIGGASFSGIGPYNTTIIDCDFIENSASVYGAISYSRGALFIKNSSIVGNKAKVFAGGIGSSADNTTLLNCLIVGNRAELDIAAMMLDSGSSRLFNCTIAGNSSLMGKILKYDGRAQESMQISNCIFANDGNEIYPGSIKSTINVSYSNIRGGWAGQGNIDEDPCFVLPGYWDPNGTPTDANDDFWVNGDYHLKTESLCVDAGDPNYAAGPDETDLDGNPRVVYGIIDMGAYEYQNNAPVAVAGPNQVAYAWIDGIAEVTLDASASYDADGDELSYLWTCSINGNPWETNIVAPTIELPVGKYTFELVVNDGTEDSEPNQVEITVVGPVKGLLSISPQVINRKCEQKRIIAMLRLPDGITKDQIDGSYKLTLYPGGIEAVNQCIMPYYANHAKRWFVFAFFDRDEVLESIGGSGFVKVYAVGQLKTGRYFYGSSTIVISNHGRRPKWGNMRDWFHNYHHSHFRRPNK